METILSALKAFLILIGIIERVEARIDDEKQKKALEDAVKHAEATHDTSEIDEILGS